jgi:putative phosphoesterase
LTKRLQSITSKLPAAALIALGGHKVFITHGHIYGARPSVPLMTDIAKENGADIVMYGHTHVPYLKKVFGVTVLNPGSISLPRQEDGKKSYAIMTVADDESVDFEICYHNE